MLSLILAVLALSVSAQRPATRCRFVAGGFAYDLSSLSATTLTGYHSTYAYRISLCSNRVSCSGSTVKASVIQTHSSHGGCLPIAYWNATAMAKPARNGKGFNITLKGSSQWCGKPRLTTLQFVCASGVTAGSIYVAEPYACGYVVKIPTKAACGTAIKTTTAKPVSSCKFTRSGVSYDLTPLAKTTLTGKHGSWTYKVSMCSNSVKCASATAPYGAITQTHSNSACLNLGYWKSPAVSVSPGSWVNITLLGDSTHCGYPRRTTLQLVCARGVTSGALTISEPSTCRYTVRLPTQYACGRRGTTQKPQSYGCKFNVGGRNYDMSALSRITLVGTHSKGSNVWTYKIRICQNALKCNSGKTSAAVTQIVPAPRVAFGDLFVGQGSCLNLGYWSSAVTASKLANNAKGFAVTLKGDSTHCGFARTTIINFVCSSYLTGTIAVSEPKTCTYTIRIPTRLACGSGATPAPTSYEESGGGKGGEEETQSEGEYVFQ